MSLLSVFAVLESSLHFLRFDDQDFPTSSGLFSVEELSLGPNAFAGSSKLVSQWRKCLGY